MRRAVAKALVSDSKLPSPRRRKETHGMTLMFLTLVFLWLRMVLHLGKSPVVPT